MSQKFLTPIDLTRNELQNAVLQNLAADPATLVEGLLWWRSDTHHVYAYNGTAAVRLDNPTAAELLTSILTVDGAGTGLDADKLDGQEGSYYLSRANHTGTQTAATISDFDTQVRTNRLDQMAAPTAAVSANGQKITNVANPTSSLDAANKSYVDALIDGGVHYRGTADASAANVDAATGTAIHVNGDQYKITTGGNTAFGFQLNAGDFVIYNGTTWDKYDNTDPSVSGTTNRVSVSQTGDTSYTIDISASYVGQTSITTLGTITTGVWNGTTIALAYGGTGATDAAGARTNLGLGTIATQAANNVAITGGSISGITDLAVADGGTGASTAAGARTNLGATGKYSATIGDGSATSIAITQATHGLATNGQMEAMLFDAASGARVFADVTINNSNGTVTFAFSVAPSANQYRAVIIG